MTRTVWLVLAAVAAVLVGCAYAAQRETAVSLMDAWTTEHKRTTSNRTQSQ